MLRLRWEFHYRTVHSVGSPWLLLRYKKKIHWSLSCAVLCQIASYYGMEALRNGHQLLGYFMDLAPKLKRECRMLKYFVDAGGHTALFNARNASSEIGC